MKLTRLAVFPLFFLLGMLFANPAVSRAQNTATISGTITDPSGAAVAGATITTITTGTTQTFTARSAAGPTVPIATKTGQQGMFSISLDAGSYRLSVEYPSFTKIEQDFTLSAGEVKAWNPRLSLERTSSHVIVTAAAEPITAETTPSLVDVITREQIDQHQEISLTDMLATQQGVNFDREGPYGGLTGLFLDGGNSNYTKVLVDGTPINEPGGAIDLSDLTLDDMDKIEIVHGASSALYGSDAMDGVIQIFSHRGSTRTPQLVVEGDGGTFDTGRGSGQLSGLLGAFDYSVGAGYFSTDGQGPDDMYRNTTLSGNFGWKFSDTDSLRLSVRNNASYEGQPGQTLIPDEANFGENSDLQNFSANLAWNFSTGEHWQDSVSSFETRFQDVLTDPPFGTFKSEYNRAGMNAQSTYSFHNGGVTFGYENEVENRPSAGRHNQAGFVEVRYQIGRRLTAIAGGRVEANGFFGTRTVPRIGAAYALRFGNGLVGNTRLRASYGQGIKEPATLPLDCGPLLKPEQSNTFDIGVDQFFVSDRVHFSATYFHNDFRDIVSFAFGGTSPNCPAFGGSYFNTDKARAYGVNSAFEAKVTRWLTVSGNYTYDDSLVLAASNFFDASLAAGNRLFHRPMHAANLVANAHFLGMNWNLSGNYVGRAQDSDFDSFVSGGVCFGPCITSNPSHVSWDLASILPIRWNLSFTARIQNLFDNHYQDVVGYPALGFNYRLGLKYQWGGD